MRAEGESEDALKQRMLDHAPIVQKYDTDCAKWESSNCKCLMVIKSSIVDAIMGAIPICITAKEYLQRVENQFTSPSKNYANSLIKSLVTMTYHGGGVREHNLKMSGITSKLKKMYLVLRVPSSPHFCLLAFIIRVICCELQLIARNLEY